MQEGYRRHSSWLPLLCIAAGMGGELHLPIPGLGFIAMLDLVSYAIALPIIFMNWNRMGRFMHRSLLFAFAWTGAAMLANFVHFIEMRYWCKCVSLASSSWAIMAAAYVLLRNYPKGYLWYLVGAGLGGWIALYYFRSGSNEAFAVGREGGIGSADGGTGDLLEKQIYPFVARGILLGLVLPFFIWWKKLPVFLILCSTMFAGFYLLFHGGSRSSFGMFCAAAAVGFAVAYSTTLMRRISKSPVTMLVVVSLGCSILFGGYKMLASSGRMGEGERQKLEEEFGKGSRGALKGRAGFDHALEEAIESGGIGIGGHLRHHSVLTNSLSAEGFIGFFFWIYFYLQCFWFLCKRIPYSGKYSSFIFLMILTAGWDVFGSPFGTRHKFFMLMTLIALCRDNPYYGVEVLFDPKMLRQMWFRGWGGPPVA